MFWIRETTLTSMPGPRSGSEWANFLRDDDDDELHAIFMGAMLERIRRKHQMCISLHDSRNNLRFYRTRMSPDGSVAQDELDLVSRDILTLLTVESGPVTEEFLAQVRKVRERVSF